MRKEIVIFISILIAFILGLLFWKQLNNPNKTNYATQKTKSVGVLPKEIQITLDKGSFNPKDTIIKVGTAIRWKNISGEKQTVNSDDYPSNQLHKELNFGVFNDGSSVVYIFTKPGTYGYHNQFHPEQKGVIQVTQ